MKNVCKILKKEVPDFLDDLHRRTTFDNVEHGGVVCKDVRQRIYYPQLCKGTPCDLDIPEGLCGQDGVAIAVIHTHPDEPAIISPEDLKYSYEDLEEAAECVIGDDGEMYCMEDIDKSKPVGLLIERMFTLWDADLTWSELARMVDDLLVLGFGAKTCREQVLYPSEVRLDVGGPP